MLSLYTTISVESNNTCQSYAIRLLHLVGFSHWSQCLLYAYLLSPAVYKDENELYKIGPRINRLNSKRINRKERNRQRTDEAKKNRTCSLKMEKAEWENKKRLKRLRSMK